MLFVIAVVSPHKTTAPAAWTTRATTRVRRRWEYPRTGTAPSPAARSLVTVARVKPFPRSPTAPSVRPLAVASRRALTLVTRVVSVPTPALLTLVTAVRAIDEFALVEFRILFDEKRQFKLYLPLHFWGNFAVPY